MKTVNDQAFEIGKLLAKAYKWAQSLFKKVKESDIPLNDIVKYSCYGIGAVCWALAFYMAPIATTIATGGSMVLYLAELSNARFLTKTQETSQ